MGIDNTNHRSSHLSLLRVTSKGALCLLPERRDFGGSLVVSDRNKKSHGRSEGDGGNCVGEFLGPGPRGQVPELGSWPFRADSFGMSRGTGAVRSMLLSGLPMRSPKAAAASTGPPPQARCPAVAPRGDHERRWPERRWPGRHGKSPAGPHGPRSRSHVGAGRGPSSPRFPAGNRAHHTLHSPRYSAQREHRSKEKTWDIHLAHWKRAHACGHADDHWRAAVQRVGLRRYCSLRDPLRRLLDFLRRDV